MSIRLAWPRCRKVCTQRVPGGPRWGDRNIQRRVHLDEGVRLEVHNDTNEKLSYQVRPGRI